MERRTLLATMATMGAALSAPSLARAQGFGGASPELAQVLQVGGFSLQTSQLAAQRSRNARVRNFAQLEAGEQVAVAAALGAQPGSVPLNEEQAGMLQQLASLSGSAFDRMYVAGQVQGHQQLLQLNSALSQGGQDASRAVAIVAVPSIQTHLYILSGLRGRA